jgi:hypothetical protein
VHRCGREPDAFSTWRDTTQPVTRSACETCNPQRGVRLAARQNGVQDATVLLRLRFLVQRSGRDADEAITKARPSVENLGLRLALPGSRRPLTLYTMTNEYREE